MMNKGCFEKSMSDSELADILDLYYQLCSLEVTVKSRAFHFSNFVTVISQLASSFRNICILKILFLKVP